MLISIVVPTYNEEGNVEKLLAEVSASLKSEKFEIIYVNDGSSDMSLQKIIELSSNDKRVKYVSFSRNFGHQAALRAGLRYAQGEVVVSMDADLQHPPELIPRLLQEWRKGYQIVYTIRKDDQGVSYGKSITSRWFYKVMNFMSGLSIEEGSADFRLLDRKVVKVINNQQEADIFLRGYINWMGFRQLGVPYIPAKRFSGQSKYTLRKMINFASHGVTQFSTKPLRLAHLAAAAAFTMSLLYIIYAVGVSLSGHAISGWLSLVVLIVFLQGIQFLLIGLVGEYVGRTFMQTKHRPEYIVNETNCQSLNAG